MESESISSSRDSRNLTDRTLINNEFTEISAQEIINSEFDNLEEWVDDQFDDIKKQCIDCYNNFSVDFPNNNKKKEKRKKYNINEEEEEQN